MRQRRKLIPLILPFISRGDDLGTNKKELLIWKEADIDVVTLMNYTSVGKEWEQRCK